MASFILMQQDLSRSSENMCEFACMVGDGSLVHLTTITTLVLPFLVLGTGLLIISHIRYPHLVNRYLRGRRSIGRLIMVLVGLLFRRLSRHEYVIAPWMLLYVLLGGVVSGEPLVAGAGMMQSLRRDLTPLSFPLANYDPAVLAAAFCRLPGSFASIMLLTILGSLISSSINRSSPLFGLCDAPCSQL